MTSSYVYHRLVAERWRAKADRVMREAKVQANEYLALAARAEKRANGIKPRKRKAKAS